VEKATGVAVDLKIFENYYQPSCIILLVSSSLLSLSSLSLASLILSIRASLLSSLLLASTSSDDHEESLELDEELLELDSGSICPSIANPRTINPPHKSNSIKHFPFLSEIETSKTVAIQPMNC